MDFRAGWKVFLCNLAMYLGSELWETVCLTSAAYAANALAVRVNAFWIHRLFTFSLNVDLLSASVGNLTQEVIGPAICPKSYENSWFWTNNGHQGQPHPTCNLWQIIGMLLGFPTWDPIPLVQCEHAQTWERKPAKWAWSTSLSNGRSYKQAFFQLFLPLLWFTTRFGE